MDEVKMPGILSTEIIEALNEKTDGVFSELFNICYFAENDLQ